jgi:hypothetical protein
LPSSAKVSSIEAGMAGTCGDKNNSASKIRRRTLQKAPRSGQAQPRQERQEFRGF